ncbi:GrlR family regulatory protein [Serratia aquatilis]|uniref:GrlR family regulatory protein n=1 Tax=Serratia aquatilis TaxID=1737515 RepID=A0ABV6ED43_9GAMM
MNDGIYYVSFFSNNQDFGTGTIVVKDKKVNGGDYGFTYRGHVKGSVLTLHILQHDRGVSSFYAGMTSFHLILDIKKLGNDYVLQGGVEGMPSTGIKIQAKFIGDMV